MAALNWGMISDGGAFESLMHAILYADDPSTILFGRPGKDAGQDARSADGTVVYQAKYRQGLVMDGAIDLAMEELDKIKSYRSPLTPTTSTGETPSGGFLSRTSPSTPTTTPNGRRRWCPPSSRKD